MSFLKVVKIKGLPLVILFLFLLGCDKMLVESNSDPSANMRDFIEVWAFVDANYPFFEYMDISSEYLYAKYHPLAKQAKGDEIFKVIIDMLAELKDGHTMFRNKTSGVYDMMPYLMPRILQDYHKFNPAVTRKYFEKDLTVLEDKTLEYGITGNNIGYIYISSFTDFQTNPREFDNALSFLKNTKALILDVRHNTGGDFYKVAGRFVSSEREVVFYNKLNKIEKEYIRPRGAFIYTQPIVILINGCSVSGAEFIAANLQPLPNVTLVGDTTAGLGGSDTETNLSSGKWVSTTRLKSFYYGNLIQWNGIPPDILVENTEQEIKIDIDSQLAYAIRYLNNLQ